MRILSSLRWTLVIVSCMVVAFTVVFAFPMHLGVGALIPGVVLLVGGVYTAVRTFSAARKRS